MSTSLTTEDKKFIDELRKNNAALEEITINCGCPEDGYETVNFIIDKIEAYLEQRKNK